MAVPRCLNDCRLRLGRRSGIQADLKAFAAAGCYGTSAIVALDRAEHLGVTAVHELPPSFVAAQLEAVFDDIGVDAAKTGMLFSLDLIEPVADFLSEHRCRSSSTRSWSRPPARGCSRTTPSRPSSRRLFPLATVLTPNLHEAQALAGGRDPATNSRDGSPSSARRAVLVTGGHGKTRPTISSTAEQHLAIAVERHEVRGDARRRLHALGNARRAARARRVARGRRSGSGPVASDAVRNGLVEIGAGEGPVNVLA